MIYKAIAVAGAVLLTGLPAHAADQKPVAIVVHPETNINELSMAELRRVLFAEQQFWSDKSRITLMVSAPATYARRVVLKRIYEMNEAQFRTYWIAKMFRAEVPSGPKIVLSSNMALELITAVPGSITFMLASEVNDTVKVVRIDGKLPGEEGYPLN